MTSDISENIPSFLSRLDAAGLSYGRFTPDLIYIVIPASYDPAWIFSGTGILRQDFDDMVADLGEDGEGDFRGISIRLNAGLQAVSAYPYPEAVDETVLPKILYGKSGDEFIGLLKQFRSLLNPESLAQTDLDALNQFYTESTD